MYSDSYSDSDPCLAMPKNTQKIIEVTNLHRTDLNLILTLSVKNMADCSFSRWSEYTKLNKYNIKFRVYHEGRYSTLYYYGEAYDANDSSQDSVFLTVKHNDCKTHKRINRFKTQEEVRIVKNLDEDVKFEIEASVTPPYGSYKALYDDETLVDFKIAVKRYNEETEEQSVGFHRTVLAAWSPVMMNMFKTSCKEKDKGVLELPVKLEVIQAFKKYVYTDELPTDRESLLGLTELGSYYMDPKLEIISSRTIVENINTCDILKTIVYALEKKLHMLATSLFMKIRNVNKPDFDEFLITVGNL